MTEGLDQPLEIVSPEAQRLLSTLSHSLTLELLIALHDSPAAVTVLAQRLEYEISAISRKLNSMLEIGLVRFTRVGRNHIYQLTPAVRVERAGAKCSISIGLEGGTSLNIRYEIET